MSFITQVFATLGWIVIAPLAISPLVWLLLQPYFRGWSRAERRAADLLRDTLTPEQFRQLVWRGYLEVPSPTEPRRVYRVPRTKGYIQVIENGRAVMRLCVQPVECLPDADVVVLHKLMIEANEETYLQKANKYVCIE
ncbi:MAG: hypothetical protein E6I59_18565 [Chloroflexi bacterium]|jgi:hypothetical protein|nr:MAG: hypothetical protein AUH05_01050 [Ktedonobacter sp. 13_2_20CM_53_11]OLB55872.1 MAG: hypothetical protein AUI01_07400 [Ktedonobacter sp. 13_2_20CM_2_56_8]OLD83400.1 MAG: hypothetical protein AUG54_02000 [Ktedonobacter sp. 13_1_20CM_4_53_7]TMB81037.1 MAG: hypothetical protein E6J48_09500 [Chloroflexota bacterium]TMC38498.1 MAG: hypothetical protein E6J31_10515 [Chloroflexota bacterium]